MPCRVGSIWGPLQEMEDATGAPLPEIDAFLPAWLGHLEQQPQAEGMWEGNRERWLREAVQRLEGTAGLERVARQTKRPEALRAWAHALADRGTGTRPCAPARPRQNLSASRTTRASFLMGRRSRHSSSAGAMSPPIQAAWVGAPTLARLLRWLGAGDPSAAALVKRSKDALPRCPVTEGRQLGLLHVLAGDAPAAAAILAEAPGLGWSREGHPGHVLFPIFASLLSEGTGNLRADLAAQLRAAPWDPWDRDWADDEDAEPRSKPRLHARDRDCLNVSNPLTLRYP